MKLDYEIVLCGSSQMISFYGEPPLTADELWQMMEEKYEDDPAMYAELGKFYLLLTCPTLSTRIKLGEE